MAFKSTFLHTKLSYPVLVSMVWNQCKIGEVSVGLCDTSSVFDGVNSLAHCYSKLVWDYVTHVQFLMVLIVWHAVIAS